MFDVQIFISFFFIFSYKTFFLISSYKNNILFIFNLIFEIYIWLYLKMIFF